MGMNKTMLGLIFGAVVGWLVGSASTLGSSCVQGEFGVLGGGATPFWFCTFPIIIVFALIGFWLGRKIEHDEPLV